MFGLTPYTRRNSASVYNPFRELDELERTFFGGNALAEFKTDITDNGKEYLLEADLPGFDRNDIHVDINGETLVITAERKTEKEDKKDNDKNGYVYRERSFGSFTRSFDLSGIDTEGINGNYTDGVLRLTLPKREPAQPASRRLELK